MRSATVVGILSPAPCAVVNLNLDGGDVQNVRSLDRLYQPQAGDNVLIEKAGDQWVVLGNTDPARTWSPWPDLEVVTSAPSGYQQVGTVYSNGTDLAVTYSTPPQPPPTGAGTLTVPATGSRTWDPSNNWRSDDTRPRQGSFGSGQNYGLWFYGRVDGVNPWAVLTGKTIKTVALTVRRHTAGGTPFARKQLLVATHNYFTQPTGQPTVGQTVAPVDAQVSTGESRTFALPVAFGQALAAGTAAGV